jgi:hypothetical protein
MRRYDDLVEVRRGLVQEVEAPEQFVWRDRLWRVCAVVSYWVETGPWWEQRAVATMLGAEPSGAQTGADHAAEDSAPDTPVASGSLLLAEREVWRVDAVRGRHGVDAAPSTGLRGTFDLTYDADTGQWHLTRCLD